MTMPNNSPTIPKAITTESIIELDERCRRLAMEAYIFPNKRAEILPEANHLDEELKSTSELPIA